MRTVTERTPTYLALMNNPKRFHEGYQYFDDHDDDTWRECVETSPYQAGDVTLAKIGDKVVKVLILSVFADYLETRGHYCPRYRIVPMKRNGEWGKLWSYIYPGNIYRAYFDSNGNPIAQENEHE